MIPTPTPTTELDLCQIVNTAVSPKVSEENEALKVSIKELLELSTEELEQRLEKALGILPAEVLEKLRSDMEKEKKQQEYLDAKDLPVPEEEKPLVI